MAKSPEEFAHQEWLGYVQPTGLVVSIPALLSAQAYINKNIARDHQNFLSCLTRDANDNLIPEIRDFRDFTQTVLDWSPDDLAGGPGQEPLPTSLEVALPEYNETLRPTYAVKEFKPADPQRPWLMLVSELPADVDFDSVNEQDDRRWHASPQAKFERLLRETEVPIGLLTSGTHLRLVYSPRGETSGYMTFSVAEMTTVAGRPIFAALHMLLCADRLFSMEEKNRLPAIMADSRKYQNVVSTKLANQVLAALNELLRGFQAANDQRNGDLLRELLANDPGHGYAGLLTVLLRLVFILYAEDRSLLSGDSVYTRFYSVTGLFDRLRADAGRFPDTMDQRYGAWAQLLALFRMIYEGGDHDGFHIPARKGYLFDADRYPFLEGRPRQADPAASEKPAIPRVSDGVVFRMLRNLLVLDGERLSYRTLDVEQIGSVYETIMGFNLEVATGPSIAIKPAKPHGAPTTINLQALLETSPGQRAKWIKDHAEQKITGQAAAALQAAETLDDLLAALEKKIAKHATPNVVPKGAMVFQPSDERRRSGSHYTPRSLTVPIVRTTLEPILKQLADPAADVPTVYEPSREDKRRYTKAELAARVRLSEKAVEAAQQARQVGTPHPSQILDLKICDPAMGSGAFLVETCRQLGDELIRAWYAHDLVPKDIPPDEDEVLYARRLIAQRCLYGVDKNDLAVDLAKLSLWLVTLAKEHPFTFLDHSLRHGDSLVGLTREQIIGFHWEPKKQKKFGEDQIQRRLDRATEARAKILNAREDVPYRDQEQLMGLADEALNVVRSTGDACVSAFFSESKKNEREERCEHLFASVADWYASKHAACKCGPIADAVAKLRHGERPVTPFHWEIEFPEVFVRYNSGFDAIVGNPPFMGGAKIWPSFGGSYRDWLRCLHAMTSGKGVDLAAHFFRRSFTLISSSGCFGLIATNTIAQGDTREAGLKQICLSGGYIFAATRRVRWPGGVAVAVSVVHVGKGASPSNAVLDGTCVSGLNSYLFPRTAEFEPKPLRSNLRASFQGCKIYGQGFVFDDSDTGGLESSIAHMNRLVESNPKNQERIFPYIGGKELGTHPQQKHNRHVINFARMSLSEAGEWPDLLNVVRHMVKPSRDELGGYSVADGRRERWWQFGTYTPALYGEIEELDRVLAISQVCAHLSFAFVPARTVFSHKITVFPFDSFAAFCTFQARPHEIWARFFSGTAIDLLRYTSSDCTENFPFPLNWLTDPRLEVAGKAYHEFRADLLARRNEGLTKTYNCFHDPHEKSSEIAQLRELHEAMDRAVLEAYGWDKLAKDARCEFLLDYEEEDDDSVSGMGESGAKKSKRKKPWRLRWPDEFRDEVLARLLELNEQRAQEERLAGLAAEDGKRQPAPKRRGRKKPAAGQTELFG